MNHVQAETDLVSQQRNPVYTNRSRDHDCPPLTTVSNLMNADSGIGTAPSSTAARSSLPSSKDYLCPRLTHTSPLHCTSTRSFHYPARLYRLCSLPYMRRRMHPHTRNRAHPQAHPHKLAKSRAHTHSHKCTLAHSHAGREGHSHMRRWGQRHRGDESKAYQRREHQCDDHRPAANAKQSSGLIWPPCDSVE